MLLYQNYLIKLMVFAITIRLQYKYLSPDITQQKCLNQKYYYVHWDLPIVLTMFLVKNKYTKKQKHSFNLQNSKIMKK